MMTGIIAADPNGRLFNQALDDLQGIASAPVAAPTDSDKLHLPQVHALNCLRDVFTNTRLATATERFVPSTLVISVRCLQKPMYDCLCSEARCTDSCS